MVYISARIRSTAMGDRQANGAAQTEDEITPALPALPTAAPLSQEEPKPVMASDPFPWRILIVLYFVIVSDGMAMQIIVRRGHKVSSHRTTGALSIPALSRPLGYFPGKRWLRGANPELHLAVLTPSRLDSCAS